MIVETYLFFTLDAKNNPRYPFDQNGSCLQAMKIFSGHLTQILLFAQIYDQFFKKYQGKKKNNIKYAKYENKIKHNYKQLEIYTF